MTTRDPINQDREQDVRVDDDIDAKRLDDLQLDDFFKGGDAGVSDHHGRKPTSPTKRAVLGALKGLSSGLKAAFKTELYKAVPSMESVVTDAQAAYGEFQDLKRDVAEQIRPIALSVENSLRKALPAAEKAIPKEMYDKITKKLAERAKEREDMAMYDTEAGRARLKQEFEDQLVTAELENIFNAQQETSRAEAVERKKNELVTMALEGARHKRTSIMLTHLYDSTRSTELFHRTIHTAYLKKSLELKYKHLFLARDTYQLLAASMRTFETYFKAITKNTMLPDIMKQQGRDIGWHAATTKKYGELYANFLSNAKGYAFKKIREKLKGGVGMLGDVIMDASTGADMYAAADAFGEKPKFDGFRDIPKGIGYLIARMGGGSALKRLAEAYGPGAKNLDKTIINTRRNMFMRMSKTRKNWQMSDSRWRRFLADFLPEYNNNIMAPNDLLTKADEGALFDRMTRQSIVEIIPGFLSKILQSTENIRLGVAPDSTSAKQTVYDVYARKFSTTDEFLANVNDRIYGTEEARSGIYSALMGSLGAGYKRATKEDPKERYKGLEKDIHRFFVNHASFGEFFDPDAIRDYVNSRGGNTNTYITKVTTDLEHPPVEVCKAVLDGLLDSKGQFDRTVVREIENSINDIRGLDTYKTEFPRLREVYGYSDLFADRIGTKERQELETLASQGNKEAAQKLRESLKIFGDDGAMHMSKVGEAQTDINYGKAESKVKETTTKTYRDFTRSDIGRAQTMAFADKAQYRKLMKQWEKLRKKRMKGHAVEGDWFNLETGRPNDEFEGHPGTFANGESTLDLIREILPRLLEVAEDEPFEAASMLDHIRRMKFVRFPDDLLAEIDRVQAILDKAPEKWAEKLKKEQEQEEEDRIKSGLSSRFYKDKKGMFGGEGKGVDINPDFTMAGEPVKPKTPEGGGGAAAATPQKSTLELFLETYIEKSNHTHELIEKLTGDIHRGATGRSLLDAVESIEAMLSDGEFGGGGGRGKKHKIRFHKGKRHFTLMGEGKKPTPPTRPPSNDEVVKEARVEEPIQAVVVDEIRALRKETAVIATAFKKKRGDNDGDGDIDGTYADQMQQKLLQHKKVAGLLGYTGVVPYEGKGGGITAKDMKQLMTQVASLGNGGSIWDTIGTILAFSGGKRVLGKGLGWLLTKFPKLAKLPGLARFIVPAALTGAAGAAGGFGGGFAGGIPKGPAAAASAAEAAAAEASAAAQATEAAATGAEATAGAAQGAGGASKAAEAGAKAAEATKPGMFARGWNRVKNVFKGGDKAAAAGSKGAEAAAEGAKAAEETAKAAKTAGKFAKAGEKAAKVAKAVADSKVGQFAGRAAGDAWKLTKGVGKFAGKTLKNAGPYLQGVFGAAKGIWNAKDIHQKQDLTAGEYLGAGGAGAMRGVQRFFDWSNMPLVSRIPIVKDLLHTTGEITDAYVGAQDWLSEKISGENSMQATANVLSHPIEAAKALDPFEWMQRGLEQHKLERQQKDRAKVLQEKQMRLFNALVPYYDKEHFGFDLTKDTLPKVVRAFRVEAKAGPAIDDAAKRLGDWFKDPMLLARFATWVRNRDPEKDKKQKKMVNTIKKVAEKAARDANLSADAQAKRVAELTDKLIAFGVDRYRKNKDLNETRKDVISHANTIPEFKSIPEAEVQPLFDMVMDAVKAKCAEIDAKADGAKKPADPTQGNQPHQPDEPDKKPETDAEKKRREAAEAAKKKRQEAVSYEERRKRITDGRQKILTSKEYEELPKDVQEDVQKNISLAAGVITNLKPTSVPAANDRKAFIERIQKNNDPKVQAFAKFAIPAGAVALADGVIADAKEKEEARKNKRLRKPEDQKKPEDQQKQDKPKDEKSLGDKLKEKAGKVVDKAKELAGKGVDAVKDALKGEEPEKGPVKAYASGEEVKTDLEDAKAEKAIEGFSTLLVKEGLKVYNETKSLIRANSAMRQAAKTYPDIQELPTKYHAALFTAAMDKLRKEVDPESMKGRTAEQGIKATGEETRRATGREIGKQLDYMEPSALQKAFEKGDKGEIVKEAYRLIKDGKDMTYRAWKDSDLPSVGEAAREYIKALTGEEEKEAKPGETREETFERLKKKISAKIKDEANQKQIEEQNVKLAQDDPRFMGKRFAAAQLKRYQDVVDKFIDEEVGDNEKAKAMERGVFLQKFRDYAEKHAAEYRLPGKDDDRADEHFVHQATAEAENAYTNLQKFEPKKEKPKAEAKPVEKPAEPKAEAPTTGPTPKPLAALDNYKMPEPKIETPKMPVEEKKVEPVVAKPKPKKEEPPSLAMGQPKAAPKPVAQKVMAEAKGEKTAFGPEDQEHLAEFAKFGRLCGSGVNSQFGLLYTDDWNKAQAYLDKIEDKGFDTFGHGFVGHSAHINDEAVKWYEKLPANLQTDVRKLMVDADNIGVQTGIGPAKLRDMLWDAGKSTHLTHEDLLNPDADEIVAGKEAREDQKPTEVASAPVSEPEKKEEPKTAEQALQETLLPPVPGKRVEVDKPKRVVQEASKVEPQPEEKKEIATAKPARPKREGRKSMREGGRRKVTAPETPKPLAEAGAPKVAPSPAKVEAKQKKAEDYSKLKSAFNVLIPEIRECLKDGDTEAICEAYMIGREKNWYDEDLPTLFKACNYATADALPLAQTKGDPVQKKMVADEMISAFSSRRGWSSGSSSYNGVMVSGAIEQVGLVVAGYVLSKGKMSPELNRIYVRSHGHASEGSTAADVYGQLSGGTALKEGVEADKATWPEQFVKDSEAWKAESKANDEEFDRQRDLWQVGRDKAVAAWKVAQADYFKSIGYSEEDDDFDFNSPTFKKALAWKKANPEPQDDGKNKYPTRKEMSRDRPILEDYEAQLAGNGARTAEPKKFAEGGFWSKIKSGLANALRKRIEADRKANPNQYRRSGESLGDYTKRIAMQEASTTLSQTGKTLGQVVKGVGGSFAAAASGGSVNDAISAAMEDDKPEIDTQSVADHAKEIIREVEPETAKAEGFEFGGYNATNKFYEYLPHELKTHPFDALEQRLTPLNLPAREGYYSGQEHSGLEHRFATGGFAKRLPADPAISKAMTLIAKHEGFKPEVYLCPAGKKTIGFGFTDKASVAKKKMTRAEANEILRGKVVKILKTVDSTLPGLNDNQRVALCSWIYNLGVANFNKSTMLKRLKEGDFVQASKEMKRWIYSKGEVLNGLVKRRAEEASLLSAGMATDRMVASTKKFAEGGFSENPFDKFLPEELRGKGAVIDIDTSSVSAKQQSDEESISGNGNFDMLKDEFSSNMSSEIVPKIILPDGTEIEATGRLKKLLALKEAIAESRKLDTDLASRTFGEDKFEDSFKANYDIHGGISHELINAAKGRVRDEEYSDEKSTFYRDATPEEKTKALLKLLELREQQEGESILLKGKQGLGDMKEFEEKEKEPDIWGRDIPLKGQFRSKDPGFGFGVNGKRLFADGGFWENLKSAGRKVGSLMDRFRNSKFSRSFREGIDEQAYNLWGNSTNKDVLARMNKAAAGRFATQETKDVDGSGRPIVYGEAGTEAIMPIVAKSGNLLEKVGSKVGDLLAGKDIGPSDDGSNLEGSVHANDPSSDKISNLMAKELAKTVLRRADLGAAAGKMLTSTGNRKFAEGGFLSTFADTFASEAGEALGGRMNEFLEDLPVNFSMPKPRTADVDVASPVLRAKAADASGASAATAPSTAEGLRNMQLSLERQYSTVIEQNNQLLKLLASVILPKNGVKIAGMEELTKVCATPSAPTVIAAPASGGDSKPGSSVPENSNDMNEVGLDMRKIQA